MITEGKCLQKNIYTKYLITKFNKYNWKILDNYIYIYRNLKVYKKIEIIYEMQVSKIEKKNYIMYGNIYQIMIKRNDGYDKGTYIQFNNEKDCKAMRNTLINLFYI